MRLCIILFISIHFVLRGQSVDSLSGKSLDVNPLAVYKSYIMETDTLADNHLYYKVLEWLGTRYRYSGENKNGIDCSGFVSRIYKDVYCLALAGSSGDIYKQTTPVAYQELKEGDLLFFKIKKGRISHVAIYLQNSKFAHASVKRGVIISDLNEAYYKKYFFTAGRILDK